MHPVNLANAATFLTNAASAAGVAYGVETAGPGATQFVSEQLVKAKEVMAPFAERVMTPITAFMNETVYPAAAPYLQQASNAMSPYIQQASHAMGPYVQSGLDAVSPYAQPIFDAIKAAPSTPIAPQVASLAAVGMFVGYKALQAGTNALIQNTRLSPKLDALDEQLKAKSTKAHRVVHLTINGLQFTIAAAATYVVGLQFGTALTLAQLFKIAGGVAASQIFSHFAIKGAILAGTKLNQGKDKVIETVDGYLRTRYNVPKKYLEEQEAYLNVRLAHINSKTDQLNARAKEFQKTQQSLRDLNNSLKAREALVKEKEETLKTKDPATVKAELDKAIKDFNDLKLTVPNQTTRSKPGSWTKLRVTRNNYKEVKGIIGTPNERVKFQDEALRLIGKIESLIEPATA